MLNDIEQAVLITAVLSHHQEVLPNTTWVVTISGPHGKRMTFFNGIGHFETFVEQIRAP